MVFILSARCFVVSFGAAFAGGLGACSCNTSGGSLCASLGASFARSFGAPSAGCSGSTLGAIPLAPQLSAIHICVCIEEGKKRQ